MYVNINKYSSFSSSPTEENPSLEIKCLSITLNCYHAQYGQSKLQLSEKGNNSTNKTKYVNKILRRILGVRNRQFGTDQKEAGM